MALKLNPSQQMHLLTSPFGLALLLGLVLPIACLLWFMLNAAEAERIAAEKRLKTLLINDIEKAVKRWQKDAFKFEGEADATSNLNTLFAIGASQSNAAIVLVSGEHGTIEFPHLNHSHTPLPQEIRHALVRAHAKSNANDTDAAIESLAKLRTTPIYRQSDRAHQLAVDYTLWRQLTSSADRKRIANEQRTIIEEHLLTTLNDYSDDISPRLRLMYMTKLKAIQTQTKTFQHQKVLDQTLRFFEKLSPREKSLPLYPYVMRESQNSYIAAPAPLTNTNTKGPSTLWILRNSRKLAQQLEKLMNTHLGQQFIAAEISQNPPEDPQRVAYHTLLVDAPVWHVNIYWQNQNAFSQRASRQSIIYFAIGISVILFLCASAAYVFYHIRKEKQLSELKSHAISTVAHELKTPLTSIRLLLDNLNQSANDPEQIKDYAQIMQREHARLSGLIDNFLTFNRLEQQQARLNLTKTDINGLVKQALLLLSDKIEQQDVTIYTDEGQLEPTYIDANLTTTCLLNLIDNACKYALAPKAVTIKTRQDYDTIYVEISDNGPGIALHEHEKLFEPYYRSDSALSRKTEGSGLGLYIAKAIAMLHAGNISVSKSDAGGGLFTLVIPVSDKTNH